MVTHHTKKNKNIMIVLVCALLITSNTTRAYIEEYDGFIKGLMVMGAATIGLAAYCVHKIALLPTPLISIASSATGLGWVVAHNLTQSSLKATGITLASYSALGLGMLAGPSAVTFLKIHKKFGIGLGSLLGSIAIGSLISATVHRWHKHNWAPKPCTNHHQPTFIIIKNNSCRQEYPFASAPPWGT